MNFELNKIAFEVGDILIDVQYSDYYEVIQCLNQGDITENWKINVKALKCKRINPYGIGHYFFYGKDFTSEIVRKATESEINNLRKLMIFK